MAEVRAQPHGNITSINLINGYGGLMRKSGSRSIGDEYRPGDAANGALPGLTLAPSSPQRRAIIASACGVHSVRAQGFVADVAARRVHAVTS